MRGLVKTDYLIVGSGLTGSVIGRLLADAGQKVLVIDRRDYVAGNIHDAVHPSGIRVHTYGPHYFRTNSDKVWSFANRFSRFYQYEAIVKSFVDGQCENWPLAASCIRRLAGRSWKPSFQGAPANFEEAALSKMPMVIYKKFVEGYTQKQWGKAPKLLSAALAARFQVREDDDPRLVKHSYQGIPENGYSQWIRRMLQGLPVELSCDYRLDRKRFHVAKKLIYTGLIDEFFDFRLGRLAYRGQKRETRHYPEINWQQVCGQVNYPSLLDGPKIRTLEWKHMMDTSVKEPLHGTVITHETPFKPDDPDEYEYPMCDEANLLLYNQYKHLTASLPGVLFCGRLATYHYLDMDQAIEKAMTSAEALLKEC